MENKTTSRAQQMQQHINDCNSSRLTVGDYCRQQGISQATYYYWLKKLNSTKATSGFIEITSGAAIAKTEIVLVNGNRVCFDSLPPAGYVKQLIA